MKRPAGAGDNSKRGLDVEAGVQVVDGIRDAGGVAEAFPADVTDHRQVTELVAAVAGRLGPIDVLVVNATGPTAGSTPRPGDLGGPCRPAGLLRQEPDAVGAGRAPGDASQGSGRIIQIDSEVADRMPPGRSAYATAKNAQIADRGWPHPWLGPGRPLLDGGDDLLGGVLLDVVRGAVQQHRPVVGEGAFPAAPLRLFERLVAVTPHDQDGQVGQTRQPCSTSESNW